MKSQTPTQQKSEEKHESKKKEVDYKKELKRLREELEHMKKRMDSFEKINDPKKEKRKGEKPKKERSPLFNAENMEVKAANILKPYIESNVYVDFPLHIAAKYNMGNYINKIFEKDSSLLNKRDNQGRTALHVAVDNRNYLASKELVRIGADCNIEDDQGNIPLHYAIIGDDNITANYLLNKRDSLIKIVKSLKINVAFIDYEVTNESAKLYCPNVPRYLALKLMNIIKDSETKILSEIRALGESSGLLEGSLQN